MAAQIPDALRTSNSELSASETHSPQISNNLLGTPNREPQEYTRNIIDYKDPGRYIPFIFLLYILGVHCLGFPFGYSYPEPPRAHPKP